MTGHYYGLVPSSLGFNHVFSSDLFRKFDGMAGCTDPHCPSLDNWIAAIQDREGIVAIVDGLLHDDGKVVWVRPNAKETIESFRQRNLTSLNQCFDGQLTLVS